MSGALAGRVRHTALRAAAAGMRGMALGALVASGLGLAACRGDTGDGLGGSVRMEWRTPRHASATVDTTGTAAPGATPAAKRDTAAAGKRDTAGGAGRGTIGGAKRDTVGAAKRDSTGAAKPDTTGGAARDTAAGARPSEVPAARPAPAGGNRPGAANRPDRADHPSSENRPGAANNEPGRLVGAMRGRGVVVWCPGPKLAIVTGVQGDTGIGLVVYPRDSLVAGTYRVLSPDTARAAAPAAAVALRLMTRNAIEGFQGRSGTLTITEVRDRHFSGKLQAEIEVVGGVRRFDLQGELSDLPIQVGGSACPS
ncbi:MAG TPA: hypothetical protein VFS33_00630 [Gemmatimonadales bacterium]|nr:hypothetical protein [Gemmatimonadales bacterium]